MAAYALVAAVRSNRAADEIRPLLGEGSSLVKVSYDDPGSLDAAFQCASAVIHLAGILVEGPGSSYEQANVATARSVVEAAKRAAVAKFVLVSATGADEKSSNGYYRTNCWTGGKPSCVLPACALRYCELRCCWDPKQKAPRR